MSATDSLHIISELQGLVAKDRGLEQYICALWAKAVRPFGARGTAVLYERHGSVTVLSHSQNPWAGQSLPMPQAYTHGLAELAAPMPKGWHVLKPTPEPATDDHFHLAVELHDHEGSNAEFCAQITSVGTLCFTLICNAQLKRQNTLFSKILDSINYGIAVSDAQRDDCPLIYVNPAFEALTGAPRKKSSAKTVALCPLNRPNRLCCKTCARQSENMRPAISPCAIYINLAVNFSISCRSFPSQPMENPSPIWPQHKRM